MEGIYFAKAAAYFGAAIAIGIGAMGPALGQGLVGMRACENTGKYPESAGKIRTAMIISCGLIEFGALCVFGIAAALIYCGNNL